MKTIKDFNIIAVPFEEPPLREDGSKDYASIHHVMLDGRLPSIGQFNPQGWCLLSKIQAIQQHQLIAGMPSTYEHHLIGGKNHYWLKLVPKPKQDCNIKT